MTLRQDTINIGIGGASNTLTELDWQTFTFVSGALYAISSGNMTNVPAGVNVPGPTYNTLLRVNAPEGSTFHVDLIYSTTTSANFQYYQIRIAGSAGSRTFTVRSIFNSSDVIPVVNGGTGGSTQAAARTGLGLGSASTKDTGTSGATIPLLNGINTWEGIQTFSASHLYIGSASPGHSYIKAGNLTQVGSVAFDARSSGLGNDYDVRIQASGGTQGVSGKGNLKIICNSLSTTSMTLDTALPVTSGGTGGRDAATALNNLGAVPITRTISNKPLTANISLVNADISGSAASGSNSDITTLTALTNIKSTKVTFQQSPTIPDAAQPYDAVNLRQLQAAGSGGGANMNGVMNNYIGAIEWFNGSRAKLPAGYIAADGQVVSRTAAETADLWAAVSSDLYVTTSNDAEWLADKANRGKYSKGATSNPPSGSGVTGSWFRVPDLNGMQSGSVAALFLRGSSNYSIGGVSVDAAPDITGQVAQPMDISTGSWAGYISYNGAITPIQTATSRFVAPSSAAGDQPNLSLGIKFQASKGSNNTYGGSSYGRDGSQEVRPNSVVGIWIIRASGAFTSANTSFASINGDATKPANGTVVRGGSIGSSYQVSGVEVAGSSLQTVKTINDATTTARLSVFNKGTGGAGGAEALQYFDFSSNGNFYMNGTANLGGLIATNIVANNSLSCGGSILANAGANVGVSPHNTNSNNGVRLWNSTTDVSEGQYVNTVGGGWYGGSWALGAVRGGSTDLRAAQLNVSTGGSSAASYMFKPNGVADALQWNNISDRRQKDNIITIDNPIEKMKQFHGVTFSYKNGVSSAGYIAQDVQKVLPQVVSADHEGMLTMNVAGVGALHHEALLVLIARVEELEAKLAALSN